MNEYIKEDDPGLHVNASCDLSVLSAIRRKRGAILGVSAILAVVGADCDRHHAAV